MRKDEVNLSQSNLSQFCLNFRKKLVKIGFDTPQLHYNLANINEFIGFSKFGEFNKI